MTGKTSYSSTTYVDHFRGVVIEDGIVFPIDDYFKKIKKNKDFTRLIAKIAVDRSSRKNTDNEI